MAIIIGIDPGLDGAMALLADPPWHSAILDLPTVIDPDIGRRVDAAALAKLLLDKLPAGEQLHVVIEALAHGGADKNRTNAFTVDSQTWTQSAIVSTFEILGVPIACYVSVATWKAMYGIKGKAGKDASATKREVRDKAVDLYPVFEGDLKRQKDHNRAEALLIAHWARKVRF